MGNDIGVIIAPRFVEVVNGGIVAVAMIGIL